MLPLIFLFLLGVVKWHRVSILHSKIKAIVKHLWNTWKCKSCATILISIYLWRLWNIHSAWFHWISRGLRHLLWLYILILERQNSLEFLHTSLLVFCHVSSDRALKCLCSARQAIKRLWAGSKMVFGWPIIGWPCWNHFCTPTVQKLE